MSRAEPVNVVVGAASGMGAAVAALLAPRGALLLADARAERLAGMAAELGPRATAMACDIAVPAQVEALRNAVGRLGALVVTAGLSPSMAAGRRIFEVNLLGLERIVRAFEGAIGEGSVAVCFASVAGHMWPASAAVDAVLDEPLSETFFDDLAKQGLAPDKSQLAYALSKRGVLRLVQRHAVAWGARGARILSLSPGIIDTGMGRLEAENQPMMARMIEASALARMGQTEEVAAVAAFLASEAASFLTGVDVLVDGGQMAALRR